MPLTKRQTEILRFIEKYLREKGFSPSLEEIARNFGIASLNAVHKHLLALEKRGFIHRLANRARSIQLATRDANPAIPLLGYVAAGQPIEAIATPEEIQVPEMFLGRGEYFALKVQGDSMIEEHIQDGDLVVVERRPRAENGEMVVALVDGENATLKRFYREGPEVRLQPANPAHAPIRVDARRVIIQGIVVGVMRRYGRSQPSHLS